jgi:alpha-tubulin suppressor-like RCC1 family protein
VSAGEGHTCGLDGSGQAYCWGTNSSGQLGNNNTAFQLTPAAVQQGGATYVQIAAGKVHTCALDNAGQAYCWGYGADGALGYGFSFGDSVPAAVTQPGGVTFTSIYVGGQHSCGLTSGGAAYCWGKNSNAQLGDSTTTTRYTPVATRMPAGVTYTDLALTGFSTCGLAGTGQAYCWGLGSSGQLGNGSTANSRLPVAVSQPAGVSFTQIRGQLTSVCGLDGNGQTWCWGNNLYGQLGNNSNTNSSTPVAVVH